MHPVNSALRRIFFFEPAYKFLYRFHKFSFPDSCLTCFPLRPSRPLRLMPLLLLLTLVLVLGQLLSAICQLLFHSWPNRFYVFLCVPLCPLWLKGICFLSPSGFSLDRNGTRLNS